MDVRCWTTKLDRGVLSPQLNRFTEGKRYEAVREAAEYASLSVWGGAGCGL